MSLGADDSAELRLVFEGLTADEHEIPANVLAQALAGMQRAVFLLAMEHEKIDVRQRERTPRRFEERYAVLVAPPQPGSLQISARVGAIAPPPLLGTDGATAEVAEAFKNVLRSVETGDETGVQDLIRDRARRHRVLESMRSMLPRAGSGLTLRIEDHEGSALLHSISAHRHLQTLVTGSTPEEESQRTVTGRLVRIHFDAHQLTLLYAPTGRELDCIYDEGAERTLLQHPRDLIQVTGTVVLNEEGQPKRIIDVDEIQELDMSPFYLTRFEYDTRSLEFVEVRVLEPQLEEGEQLLTLADGALGIDVFASTRDELFESLRDELDVLWRNYAQASDDELSPAAQVIKRNLLQAITESKVAAR